jgi:hypothetical protein
MMLDIADRVAREFASPEAPAGALRVAFIRTTDPVFLIFAPHRAHPRYVAKVGRVAALRGQFDVETRLHALLPDAVARPLGILPLDHEAGVIVHDGAPGQPWFRLADEMQTTEAWMTLRARCLTQLADFEAAVASQPDWVAAPVRHDLGLRALATSLHDVLAPLDLSTLVAAATAALEDLGPQPAPWQHGDFVLNNLVIDDRRMTVLDLVDFGRWRVPLLDACALACSLHLHAPAHVPWHPLDADLAACLAGRPAAGCTAVQKLGFFVYFLLAAVSDTLGRPTREGVRAVYLDLLRDVARDPVRYRRALEG